MSQNSFGAKDKLVLGDREHEIFRLDRLQERFDVARLPFSLKMLLENLLRPRTARSTRPTSRRSPSWDAKAQAEHGDRVHAGARADAGLHRCAGRGRPRGDARRDGTSSAAIRKKINPLAPAELVIDHSVQVDEFGTRRRLRASTPSIEFERNRERYAFLRWGQTPSTTSGSCRRTPASCHQVNLEYLARVVFDEPTAHRPGLSRHAGRHRLAHHDDQRPRACSAGASAASRPRPPCSASRSPC